MFRVVPHPSLGAQSADAVDTVFALLMGGGTTQNMYSSFQKINCVTLHLVRYILQYYYDARTHERKKKKIITLFSVCFCM